MSVILSSYSYMYVLVRENMRHIWNVSLNTRGRQELISFKAEDNLVYIYFEIIPVKMFNHAFNYELKITKE